jgi:hypothetical protein
MMVFVLLGCGPSQHRKEGVEELDSLHTTVHGLTILASAGIAQQEYSRRVGDALLKLGDLDGNAKQVVPKFKDAEKTTVLAVYAHLSKSVEAYTLAKDYFGKKYDSSDCEEGCSDLPTPEYDAIRGRFLNFPELHESYLSSELRKLHPEWTNVQPGYDREDMLRALWIVAEREESEAKTLIDGLRQ